MTRSYRRLEDEHGCAIDGVLLYRLQSFIGLIKGKGRYPGPKINLGGDLDKISGIGARHIGHAAKLPLSPQQAIVVKFRNPVEMNRVDRNHSAFSQTPESGYNYISAGRKSHRPV
jgi:hypothetical protein